MGAVGNMAAKVIGVTVTASLFILCFTAELWECYVSYVVVFHFTGAIYLITYIYLCGSALLNAVLTMTRNPGEVPAWLSVSRVDEFVVGELERLASGPRTDDARVDAAMPAEVQAAVATSVLSERRTDRISFMEDSDAETDGGAAGYPRQASASDLARANDVLTRAQEVRSAYEEDPEALAAGQEAADAIDLEADDAPTNGMSSAAGGAAVADDAYRAFPGDHPDRMVERRQRKRRHGLRVRTVADVAYEALCRVRAGMTESRTGAAGGDGSLVPMPDGEPCSKDEQMQVLLLGATRCRFCQCYKLQETHHCSRCERCVYHMDHHCDWLGCCVGADNQKNFLLFLLYVCAACILTTLLSFYILYIGINYLFFEEFINLSFFLAFTVVTSFALMLPLFAGQQLYDLGRGETTLRTMRREERQAMQQLARRVMESATYEPVFEEEEDNASRRFQWANISVAFGIGRCFPDWLLPSAPVRAPSAETEAAFWTDVRDMVERQVYAIADSTGEGRSSARTAAVPMRPDAIDDWMNVQVDLIEPELHMPAAAAALNAANQPAVLSSAPATSGAEVPQPRGNGVVIGPPRASPSAMPDITTTAAGKVARDLPTPSDALTASAVERGTEATNPITATGTVLPKKPVHRKAD